MSGDNFFKDIKWRKIGNNDKDIFPVQDMLRDLENNYVSACARFLTRNPQKDPVWILTGKNPALIINNRSTLLPVFCGLTDIPKPKFLKNFSLFNKVHSIQGLKEEVILLEDTMSLFGNKISDKFDYDLMSLDYLSCRKLFSGKSSSDLVLRIPTMSDLDALAPLQAAYEHEEVMHKGSVFSPAASRVNLANIIKNGKILSAQVNGRLVGKINVSGTSFTNYLIGGVFVHPDFRGRGIARQMTADFITSLTADGKSVTLFVKKTNIAARNLYIKLGFSLKGDYRITYFYD